MNSQMSRPSTSRRRPIDQMVFPVSRIVDQLTPSSRLLQQFNIDPFDLIMTFTYDWFQYFNGEGRYYRHAEMGRDQSIVLEEVKGMLLPNLLVLERTRDVLAVITVIDRVGWEVCAAVDDFNMVFASHFERHPVCAVEGWLHHDLVIRMRH